MVGAFWALRKSLDRRGAGAAMLRRNGLALAAGRVIMSTAAAMPQTSLRAPAAAEFGGIENKLDRDLLPDGATQFEVEDKQIFKLLVKNAVELTLVPVKFKIPVQGSREETSRDCGVYLVSASGTVDFIRLLDDDLPIQCWSIDAVRLDRTEPDHPSIILKGNLTTANSSWPQSFVLRRDKEAGTYKMDTVDFK